MPTTPQSLTYDQLVQSLIHAYGAENFDSEMAETNLILAAIGSINVYVSRHGGQLHVGNTQPPGWQLVGTYHSALSHPSQSESEVNQ